jgi:Flp pilus assembly protein TadG
MKTLCDESGQTLVLAALCMALLLGFLALAVDVGLLFHARRVMQTAADSGAIAGAEEITYGDVTAAAQADAALNGVSNGVQGATVIVNQPPANGPYAGNAAYVEVIASQPQQTYFMNVFGRNSVGVTGRAVATLTPTQNCIYTLGASGTDISISGGSVVQTPGCGIIDNSSSSTALQVAGQSTLTATSIGIVGGYSVSSGSAVNPNPTTGVAPINDPLASLMPPSFSASSCLTNPNFGGGGTYTVGAGGTTCYNGLTVAGGTTVYFNPGVYVINGAFSVSGGAALSGSGVTFYLTPGASVSITGGGVLDLIAPTSGTYNGILFYEDRSDTQSGSIAGGAYSTLEGILYFPDASLALNGGSSSQVYASVIAGALSISGGTTLKNYAIINPATPLTTPKLVE